jgi:hypothetical protein
MELSRQQSECSDVARAHYREEPPVQREQARHKHWAQGRGLARGAHHEDGAMPSPKGETAPAVTKRARPRAADRALSLSVSTLR